MKGLHKYIFAIFFLALFSANAISATEPSQGFSLAVRYHLELAADGTIEKLVSSNKISIELTKSFDKQIRSWKFTPGATNGVPQRTETTLALTVEAVPTAGGNFKITIIDATTGVYFAKRGYLPPEFSDPLLQGNAVTVRVLAIYNAFGKVIRAELPDGANPVNKELERVSLASAKQWRFAPEKVAGRGIAGSAIVPIQFCSSSSDCDSQLTSSKENEKLALELAAQVLPASSQVSIDRGPQIN